MNVLITGSAGFIGFHLARTYLEKGHYVTGVDSVTDYYSVNLKIERLRILCEYKKFKFRGIDIQERFELERMFQERKYDLVIHLAAQPGVRVDFKDSERYSRSNLLGFGNILQTVTQYECPIFLYASSSSVYGNTKIIPFNEELSTPQPFNYYGGTKLANEILASSSTIGTRTTSIGLRFFTVYGPWGRPDMAYFKILLRNLLNRDFTLFGSGETLRDFTYVGDVTKSIQKLAEKAVQLEKGTNTVVNIGGGNPKSMNQLISLINDKTGYSGPTKMGNTKSLEMNTTAADTSLLRELIDYVPDTGLSEGLNELVEWAVDPEILKLIESL